MKILRRLLFIGLVVSPSLLKAQNSVQQLEKYLKQVSADNSIPLPAGILNDAKNEKALLKILFNHRSDAGEDLQFRVLDLVRMIGLKSVDPGVRAAAVTHLVKSTADKNPRVSGIAISSMIQFSKADFSSEDKDSVVSYLRSDMPKLDELFRLAGFLEIASAKAKISSLLNSPMSQVQKWNARLALARMGDEEAVNFILEKITTSAIDDAFIYSIVPGLVYTRNKKVFAELEKILQSDTYGCHSSHPDSKATVLCAYRVLENVAGAIEKFPIKVDDAGDMIVDNYQSALETARRWFKQNPDYKLNTKTM